MDGSLHESCIDLCMVRDVGSVLAHTKSLIPFAAGHDLITMNYNLSRTIPSPPPRFIRSWRNVTPAAINIALSPLLNVPAPATRENDYSLEQLVSTITSAIISAADHVAPLRPVRLTAHHKPWVDCEVRRLMHARDRAYRRFRRCHRNSDLVQYKALRAKVRSTLDTKKNMYYAAKMEDSSSPNALWRTLRSLVLNSTLNWDSHISSISSKIHYSLYSLRYHRNSLTRHLRQRLVQALILPHLDYAAAVLTSLTVEQELRLQRLQNACIRFIYGNIPRTEHVTPYRLALGWLSVKRRRDQLMVLQARKIIISNTPSCLATRFTLLEGQEPARRVTRRLPPRLDYSSANTSTLQRSFSHTTTKLINSIPSPFSLQPNTPNPRFSYDTISSLSRRQNGCSAVELRISHPYPFH
ncbi:unnamed protein product [Trichogramma brassicae]|uniref:Uncharacterized protein n=1 Tax=Trichogramma brassicae TaxID=86971 RepID=A0A6H5IRG3_9HYME|nr:unnamed protein product [Trichogramma brassicae]